MLTDEQKTVLRQIMANLDTEPMITLGGYAGTGKSTIIKVLLDALQRKGLSFAVCAYTGKACNVLRKKGMTARTIHSTIYAPTKDENDETYWYLKRYNDILNDGIQGFIIDEASMVSREIHQDLMSFGLPVIYVGDHGQLEPIGGHSFNLMEKPMYRLEQVHRNAGEIAHFAEHLRKGHPAETFEGATKVQIIAESAIEDRHLAAVDQIIVAFNKTRVKVNERVRKEKKIDCTFIAKEEKIICLRNHKLLGLFNGMQGVVDKVHKSRSEKYGIFDFWSDGVFYPSIKYDPDQFGKDSNQFDFKQEPNPFDYAYAITAHKAQGDQFGNIVVFEQECDKWDHVRWTYTAASRAMNGIIWLKRTRFRPSYLS
jgi:exodeoxyribonuclease-5